MIHRRRMQSLEVFVHPGRRLGEAARSLAQDLRRTIPDLEVMIHELPEARIRTETVGVLAVPAFVLDGAVLTIGVPTKDWLVQKLRGNSRKGEREWRMRQLSVPSLIHEGETLLLSHGKPRDVNML